MRRFGPYFTAAITIGAVAILAGCGDGTGPQQLNGAYELISIDGRALPTTVNNTECGPRYENATLSFVEGSRDRVVLRRVWTRNGCTPFYGFDEFIDGSYSSRGAGISLSFDPPNDGLTTNAGQGSVSADGAEISVQLRDASTSPPPIAMFVFRRQ
jgi:hypothetical protein